MDGVDDGRRHLLEEEGGGGTRPMSGMTREFSRNSGIVQVYYIHSTVCLYSSLMLNVPTSSLKIKLLMPH